MVVLPADWMRAKLDPVGKFLGVRVVLEANFNSGPKPVFGFVSMVHLGVFGEAKQLDRGLVIMFMELNWESGPN